MKTTPHQRLRALARALERHAIEGLRPYAVSLRSSRYPIRAYPKQSGDLRYAHRRATESKPAERERRQIVLTKRGFGSN